MVLPTLLPVTSEWGIWGALAVASAIGLWSERTRVGKELSGALVATLFGLAFSNVGIIPSESGVYDIVNRWLLPLAVPLLLFSANLRRVISDTGRLLIAFVLGSCATVAGTVTAMKFIPLISLGSDGWKVAAALAARHIGGAVNYVGVAETLGISSSAQAAGLAADNLICAVYFATLYALARGIPPDTNAADPNADLREEQQKTITVLHGTSALAISFVICYVGVACAKAWGLTGSLIPIVTAATVMIATLFPGALAPYVSSAEGIAAIIMQVPMATWPS